MSGAYRVLSAGAAAASTEEHPSIWQRGWHAVLQIGRGDVAGVATHTDMVLLIQSR